MTLHPHLRRFLRTGLQPAGAAWAVFAVLALSILSVSPDAHAWIHGYGGAASHGHAHAHAHGHHDGQQEPGSAPDSAPHNADHVCAVTLAQQGFCDTSPVFAGTQAPSRIEEANFVAQRRVAWRAPDHWLQPAQGPPPAS